MLLSVSFVVEVIPAVLITGRVSDVSVMVTPVIVIQKLVNVITVYITQQV